MRQVGFSHAADDAAAVHHGLFLPTEPAGYDISHPVVVTAAFDHFTHCKGAHDRANGDGCRIIANVGNPAAHCGFH
jgi:hypothetical protein